MEYAKKLEDLADVAHLTDAFEKTFDSFWKRAVNASYPVHLLRGIKLFLHHSKNQYRPLYDGSLLDSTDCLTLASLATILASRKNIPLEIATPKGLKNMHALIAYPEAGIKKIFKLSGRVKQYELGECNILSPEDVVNRLKVYRPVVNFVNYIRGRTS